MENIKCPLCNKKTSEPINLRCDHHPCFQCASQILTVDQESTLETRYRIVCPLCHKKTITYDLRHLIMNATEQDEDMYVTTKFINKKPEVLAKKCNNYVDNEKGTHAKKNSHGIVNVSASNRPVNVECKKHPSQPLQYFCEECSHKNSQQVFLCNECTKGHKHKLANIRDAWDKIQTLNQRKRLEVVPSRRKYIDEAIGNLLGRKQAMAGEFEQLHKQIADEFKVLYHYINDQYEQIKKEIKATYHKQSEQIKTSISIATRIKDSLISLEKYSYSSKAEIEAHVSYSMCVSDIESAIESAKFKLTQKFQPPRITKKVLPLMTQQKIFQIQNQTNRNSKSSSQASKPITPTGSARLLNYSIDQIKASSRNENYLDISLVKQNFYPLSPKNYLANKLSN